MKGNAQILGVLNQRLAEELTAISMYMVHAEMCANWRFEKLHEAFQKLAIDEMKHAETLIEHISFPRGHAHRIEAQRHEDWRQRCRHDPCR